MDLLAGFPTLRISRFQVGHSSLLVGPAPGPSFIQKPGQGRAGLRSSAGCWWLPADSQHPGPEPSRMVPSHLPMRCWAGASPLTGHCIGHSQSPALGGSGR